MAKISSGTFVTALTLGALSLVGALAVQANGSEHQTGIAASPGPAATAPPPPGTAVPKPRPAPALPASSGTGKRIVYSLSAHRVWLVDPAHKPRVLRTYTVQPSTVDPLPGTYTIYQRNAAGPGSDGRPIEHAVLFGQRGGTVIGFSAAVDGATPLPAPGRRTGGIRETRPDGQALWEFTVGGGRVIVVD